jgi:co-chaperonin GroES (HSP10)
MASDSFTPLSYESLQQAFPDVDSGVIPLGARVLVQLKRTANVTKSGLVIVEETKETVKWNNQVARVVALGPIAYKNRETARDWPEGAWVAAGDYVRVPRWGGDRIEIPVKDGEPVTFAIFQDHEIISKVVGDPLMIKTYIL